jgi:hypothetical protein
MSVYYVMFVGVDVGGSAIVVANDLAHARQIFLKCVEEEEEGEGVGEILKIVEIEDDTEGVFLYNNGRYLSYG